jgi:hypothetical protein
VEVPITSDALVRGVSKVAKARFVSPAGIYHCDGARTENNNDLLKRSFFPTGSRTRLAVATGRPRTGLGLLVAWFGILFVGV